MSPARRVAVFMGTRPEVIKLAPVVKRLRAAEGLSCSVVSTGQHREMFEQTARVVGIEANADLGVMRPNQALAGLSARLIEGVDGWLDSHRPDLVLVQGDTSTVLMTALACFYRRIPVGHVEAGLRTGNLASPFPEEANRRLAAPLVALHFAPTEGARQALLREGIDPETVHVTGNTVIDALLSEVETQRCDDRLRISIQEDLATMLGPQWWRSPLVLITGHRREHFGEGVAQICEAIRRLAATFADHRFVYPVHLNPNIREHVTELLGGLPNVHLIPPQGYRNFVALMSASRLVLTDSGGVQEEAPSLAKPVLVMRDNTERPEGLEAGTALLTGPRASAIVEAATRLLTDPAAYEAMARAKNPYGDGNAAERILEHIRDYLN